MKVQEVIDKLSAFDPNADIEILVSGITDNYGYEICGRAAIEWIGQDISGLVIQGTDLYS